MQLPRGTFREIRKGVTIESLLNALDGEKFSGVASISSPSLHGSLVSRAGKCILVKIRNSRGDTGWDELQKALSEEVDAALSALDDAQIELALEFNKPCRILKSGKHIPASHRPAHPVSRELHKPVHAQKPAVPAAPLKPPAKFTHALHTISAPQSTNLTPASPRQVPAPHTTIRAPARGPPPSANLVFKPAAPQVPPLPPLPPPGQEDTKRQDAGELPEKESFENDLDTFDTMDFENVTDKIRTDCKTMIKQLHLDHLMEH